MLFRARTRTRRRAPREALVGAAAPLLAIGLLAGCSGTPDTEEPVVHRTTDDSTAPSDDGPAVPGGQDDTGDDGDENGGDENGGDENGGDENGGDENGGDESSRDDGGGDDGGDGTAGPETGGEVNAQLQPDGSILVEGDHASFLMPSQNVACVVRPDQVLCQIDGKEYDARDRDITPEAFEGCTPSTADAMSVGGGADPAWACLPYDLRPGTDVSQGGSWAGPGLGATTEWEDARVALLPYGTTLRLGNISCTSDPLGVKCTDLVSGHGFQLARERYSTH